MESIDEFVSHLSELGLSEYEAKVFFVVFRLKSAAIRDIYEISRVPRNKIYGILDGLCERGFVLKIQDKPLRYAVAELEKTFVEIRKKEMEKIARAESYLLNFENSERQSPRPQAYDVQSAWVVENHLQTLIRQAKSELIFVAADIEYFKRKFSDAELKRFAKKVDLYVVVPSAKDAQNIPVTCYTLEDRFIKSMQNSIDVSFSKNNTLSIISDRKAMMSIFVSDENVSGSVMYFQPDSAMIQIMFETFLKYLIRVG